MRARKLAVAAVLGAALLIVGSPSDGVPTAEAQAVCAPPTCRKLSLFGIRFAPRVFRVVIPVSETYSSPAALPTALTVSWFNGDRTAHNIRSTNVRRADGVVLAQRDGAGVVTCDTAAGACYNYTSGNIPREPRRRAWADRIARFRPRRRCRPRSPCPAATASSARSTRAWPRRSSFRSRSLGSQTRRAGGAAFRASTLASLQLVDRLRPILSQ